MIIAVYGTLKKGFVSNGLLNGFDKPDLIEEGFYSIEYAMYDTGSYPVLIKEPGKKNSIYLEVYNVPDESEKRLDAYEGYPLLFNKEKVILERANKTNEETIEATIYVAGEKLIDNFDMFRKRRIESGNYGS